MGVQSGEENENKAHEESVQVHPDVKNSADIVQISIDDGVQNGVASRGGQVDANSGNADGGQPAAVALLAAATADGENGLEAHQTEPESESEQQHGTFWAIFESFFLLGWTAFGGPAAHIALFHKQFVEKRKWMSEQVFAELLALTQAMPGPSSTQMSFCIGILQRGVLGGLLSGMLFQYPGLVVMSLAGFGAAKFLVYPAAWLSSLSAGLSAVAVALVAEAALSLGAKLCRNRITQSLATAATVITVYYQSQWVFPTLIVAGGVITILASVILPRLQAKLQAKPSALPPATSTSISTPTSSATSTDSSVRHLGVTPVFGAVLIGCWLAVLIGTIIAANATSYAGAEFLHWFQAFYTTGSVIYGGGQVVLPLLNSIVVKYDTVCPTNGDPCYRVQSPQSWVTEEQFLAGLALAQAMPGPLFNFAAYLGAIVGQFAGIVACWVGLFSPGIILAFGILPYWGRFRHWWIYKQATPGLNATAVGLIWSSVFSLGIQTYSTSPFPFASLCIAMIGFASSYFLNVPAPLAIIGGGGLGVVAWATKMK